MSKAPERGARRMKVHLLAQSLVLALCGLVRAATDVAPAAQDPSVRRNAVSALAGADGQGVVEALIRSLADADVAVRRASAAAMGSRFRDDASGKTPSTAVSALSRALQDANMLVRWAAVDALKRIGPGAREALPALRAACRDADTNVSKAAREAVGAFEAIPSTVVIDTPPTTPSAAAGTVHRGRTLGEWAQAFLSSDAASEDEARRALNEVGAAAFPVLQAIAQSAADRNVRRKALGYIGVKGGHGAAEVVEAFLRTDPDGGIRATAAAALADLANRGDVDAGRRVERIIPKMLESLGKDPAPTGVPVTSLSRIGALAVPALEKAAKGHASANVREGAVHCLKQSKNAKVASTLIHALKDRSPAVRLAVINAIPWIVGTSSPWMAEAVAGLAAALKDPDSDVKKAAARIVAGGREQSRTIGPRHASAVIAPGGYLLCCSVGRLDVAGTWHLSPTYDVPGGKSPVRWHELKVEVAATPGWVPPQKDQALQPRPTPERRATLLGHCADSGSLPHGLAVDIHVRGPEPTRVGDKLIVNLRYQNLLRGKPVLFGRKGVFAAARHSATVGATQKPRDFGYQLPYIAFRAESQSIEGDASLIVDAAGAWVFWPSFELEDGQGAPERWCAVSVQVEE